MPIIIQLRSNSGTQPLLHSNAHLLAFFAPPSFSSTSFFLLSPASLASKPSFSAPFPACLPLFLSPAFGSFFCFLAAPSSPLFGRPRPLFTPSPETSLFFWSSDFFFDAPPS